MKHNRLIMVLLFCINTFAMAGSGDLIVNNRLGVGTPSPEYKFHLLGGQSDSKLLLRSTGDGSTNDADLVLWASEPGLTYTGVGISNNINNFNGSASMTRLNTSRGGSYIRLLDNSIKLSVVDANGITKTPLVLGPTGIQFPDGTMQGTAGSASLAQNGWQKLPSGLIIQWGYASSNTTVSFPIPFQNAALSVTANMNWESNRYENVYVSRLTKTNFLLGLAGANVGCYWMAIGY